VSRRVDGGDGVTEGGHAVMCPGLQARCFLVEAATVAHQHQGHMIGVGYGRPEYAGHLAESEIAFDDTG
jgi:hypothetical protein